MFVASDIYRRMYFAEGISPKVFSCREDGKHTGLLIPDQLIA